MIPLIVIRHGSTDWNETRLVQGRTDRPLSEAGRRQVRDMRLPVEWKDAQCLASPLQRAMETATLLGLSPEPEPRLIEMAWGEWEGQNLEALRQRLGDAMDDNEARGLDFRPPGGECPRDVQARLGPLLQELHGRTIFVTHKGVLRALYAVATGWAMTGKAPHRLLDGRAHAFNVIDGRPAVAELNIALEPPA